MRKLVYFIASTLDGFVTDPAGSDPSGPGGYWPIGDDYLHHLVAHYPETLPGPARQALGITDEGSCFDTALEGRRSYEIGLAAGVTDAYPHLRHIVFSRTLTPPDPAVIVEADPVTTVRRLKEEAGKDLWLVGGGEIAGALRHEIDRVVVKLAPLTLGAGLPLLGRTAGFDPQLWELTDHTVLDSGTLFLTYDRSSA
ncbi:dihydrofolate reductase family protein [Nocardioides caricicola]|uniref:Dihydrofolate reductase family protein n=1 Tax=Nocardioides caricicola TaxID=634770 RepID=A0ABW0N3N4_9ACTN